MDPWRRPRVEWLCARRRRGWRAGGAGRRLPRGLPRLPGRHGRQRRVPQHPGGLRRRQHRCAVVGAQRLQHRPGGHPDRVREARGPHRTAPAVRRGWRRSRRPRCCAPWLRSRLVARRGARGPGCRGSHARPRLARPRRRGFLPAAPGARGRAVGRDRCRRCGARPAHRRCARAVGQLALGLPREPPRGVRGPRRLTTPASSRAGRRVGDGCRTCAVRPCWPPPWACSRRRW